LRSCNFVAYRYGLFEPVFPDLVEQRAVGEIEELGGASAVSRRALEGLGDQLALVFLGAAHHREILGGIGVAAVRRRCP